MYLQVILLLPVISVVAREKSSTRVVYSGNGPVRGKSVHSYGGHTGYSFLGIPYARPPVGELRFKAPQPVQPWTDVLDGTTYRQGCISDKLSKLLDPTVMTTEDCLFTNVFTTAKCLEKQDCPVLVFIHGGGFKYLSPRDFNEETLINNFANEARNIVVVLPAFRGDLLGWMNLAPNVNISADSNVSLRDNLAGLEWIQQEIRYFGGDPQRVTLMGHSSGATVVEMLSYLPAFQGLFSQVVSMSGFDFGGDYSRIGNSKYSQIFAVRSGCASQEEKFVDMDAVEEVLRCLRELPADRILELLNSGKDEAEEITGPWIDGPKGIFPTYQDDLRNSRFPVNMLIGTLTGEKRDIRRIMAKNGTELVPQRLLEYCDHLGHELQYEEPELFADICYETYSKANRTELLDDEKTFYVHSINVANSLVNKAKVYVYSFSYMGGAKSWTKFSPDTGFGPSHSQDLIYVMGLNRVNFTDRDRQIDRIYSGMMANFISKGDPSYGGYSWKQWTTQEMNYFHIDFDEEFVLPGSKVGYHKEAFMIWNNTFPRVAGKPRPLKEFARYADCYSMRSVLLNIASDYQNVSQTKKSLPVEEASYKSWRDFLTHLKQTRRLALARRNVDLYNFEETTQGWTFGEFLLMGGLLCLIFSAIALFMFNSRSKKDYVSY